MTQKDRWTDRLAGPWLYWPACAAGMVMVAAAVLGPEADRRLDVERQVAAMQAEVDALARTRSHLAAIEKALQTDQTYLERTVRHELGIVRPGEVRLPQQVKPGAAAAAPGAAAARELPTPMEVLALFGNPHLRLVTLVFGTALVAAAILFSLPGRATVQS